MQRLGGSAGIREGLLGYKNLVRQKFKVVITNAKKFLEMIVDKVR